MYMSNKLDCLMDTHSVYCTYIFSTIFTLWLFNMKNGPFIDGLPIKNGGSFHGYVSYNQMVE